MAERAVEAIPLAYQSAAFNKPSPDLSRWFLLATIFLFGAPGSFALFSLIKSHGNGYFQGAFDWIERINASTALAASMLSLLALRWPVKIWLIRYAILLTTVTCLIPDLVLRVSSFTGNPKASLDLSDLLWFANIAQVPLSLLMLERGLWLTTNKLWRFADVIRMMCIASLAQVSLLAIMRCGGNLLYSGAGTTGGYVGFVKLYSICSRVLLVTLPIGWTLCALATLSAHYRRILIVIASLLVVGPAIAGPLFAFVTFPHETQFRDVIVQWNYGVRLVWQVIETNFNLLFLGVLLWRAAPSERMNIAPLR